MMSQQHSLLALCAQLGSQINCHPARRKFFRRSGISPKYVWESEYVSESLSSPDVYGPVRFEGIQTHLCIACCPNTPLHSHCVRRGGFPHISSPPPPPPPFLRGIRGYGREEAARQPPMLSPHLRRCRLRAPLQIHSPGAALTLTSSHPDGLRHPSRGSSSKAQFLTMTRGSPIPLRHHRMRPPAHRPSWRAIHFPLTSSQSVSLDLNADVRDRGLTAG